jgi:hypothetical protein
MQVAQINASVTKVRVNKLAANLVAIVLTVLLCAAFVAFARWLPHFSATGAAWQAPAALMAVVLLVVVHEALHAVGMVQFGRISWRDIRFGILWWALMPYCHCTVPLSIRAFRRMALLPLWITGGMTLACLLVFPSDLLALVTGFTVAACVGDVWIVAKLRRFNENWLVADSPSEIGCDVFSPDKEAVPS